ncbi:MAG: endonuclease/exonuclease/phosphatase family protein [Phycisphaerales bacterium JB050]
MFAIRVLVFTMVVLCLGTTPARADVQLQAMSFNIRYGTANDGKNRWQNRSHLVGQVLQNHKADVVGLQEALAFQLNEITEACPEYGVIGVGRDDGKTKGEYSAILYRIDRFTVDTSGTFWLSDTPEAVASTSWGNSITRICTWARLIDRESGQAVYIYNTHYDHRSQPAREQSSRLIARRIRQRTHADPVLLMGDFNAGETNGAITTLLDGEEDPGLVHTYRAVHPDEKTVGTFNGFTGESNGEMIDHIFATEDIEVVEAGIDRTNDDGQYPSDHYPVWVQVRLR